MLPGATATEPPYMAALELIRSLLPESLRTPKVGIVCGSGLQGLVGGLSNSVLVPYSKIPGFPSTTVQGHTSALAFGLLGSNKVPVVCLLGRFHLYEGHPPSTLLYPIRLLKLLGIESIIITNAAGGLREGLRVGDVVVLWDHISLPSLTSMNPLIGVNDDKFGPRFPPMSDAYTYSLRLLAFKTAKRLGWAKEEIKEGVYAWVAGPTYETIAEQKFLKAAGADVVGMSTVPEVIAARHAGIKVLVLSLVTNMVVASDYKSAQAVIWGEQEEVVEKEVTANHQEVLETSARRAEAMRSLVEGIVDDL